MVIAFFVFLILGCSSGGGNPVEPLANSNSDFDSLMVGVSDYDEAGNPTAGYGALGIFDVHIDANSLTGGITPIRKGNLTDVLEVVDITNFLQMAPCADCAKIMGIELDSENHVVVSIGIKHPFPPGDPLKPISGKNRADLHVFNIEGIVISNDAGSAIFPTADKSVSMINLLSADGYTGYLDSKIDEIFATDADLHPYVLHFDDYSSGNFNASNPMGFENVTVPPPSGNLVMAMGCDYDEQDYVFDLTSEAINFVFAIGCTYAVSAASKSERFTPEYRIPQHLKKAASEVQIEITRNQLAPGLISSDADIEVSVVDPSHGVAAGTGLDEMLAASDVASVTIDIPGVLANPAISSTPSGGTGHDPSDPLIFEFTIENEEGAPPGIYNGLVKVLDSYAPGLNTSPLLSGMDCIGRVHPHETPLSNLFAIDEFATYQFFSISVLLDGVYVDADNAGDPLMDGSFEHPLDVIQGGINLATSLGYGYVYVFPATATYDYFTLNSDLIVMGLDLTGGNDRPIVIITEEMFVFADNVSNSSIENLVLDFDINERVGYHVVYFRYSDGMAVRNCRFTGESAGENNSLLRFYDTDNITIEDCEFVDIMFDKPPDANPLWGNRTGTLISIEGDPSTATVMHNEFHNIEIPDLGYDKWRSQIIGIWIHGGGTDISIRNNLFYDFNDNSPTDEDGTNSTTSMIFYQIQSQSNEFVHNTMDNFDPIHDDTSVDGWSGGLYMAGVTGILTINNNIFKCENYYIGTPTDNWNFGFWGESFTSTSYADHTCVYFGPTPIPPQTQIESYRGMISEGSGSYNHNDGVDPDFDYTLGANFYHPNNTDIATGAEDGSEMGCFGGPDGDWTPPSQIYN